MSVEVGNETNWSIDPKQFSDLGVWVMDQMKISAQSDLTLTFVDPAPIATLHEKWMNLEGPTDVMSFPMDELRPGTGSVTPAGILGDIVICPDVAVQQAAAAGHSAVEEIMLLTTHGILHLLGFDHASPEQEHQMFMLQRQLLLTFLAQRPGNLEEIRLEPGSVDMLARYYADVAAQKARNDKGPAGSRGNESEAER
jgi:probable rRNA maturation factor